jgi:hypothetical protein
MDASKIRDIVGARAQADNAKSASFRRPNAPFAEFA